AVVLYQMLTGRLPFEGTSVQLIYQIGNMQPPSPTAFRTDLDPKLAAILRTAMERKPEQRYPTVQGFLAALTTWLRPAAAAAAAAKGASMPTAPVSLPPP